VAEHALKAQAHVQPVRKFDGLLGGLLCFSDSPYRRAQDGQRRDAKSDPPQWLAQCLKDLLDHECSLSWIDAYCEARHPLCQTPSLPTGGIILQKKSNPTLPMKFRRIPPCYTARVRGSRLSHTIILTIFALATGIALVTSVSSLAMRANTEPAIVHNPQEITPTPEEVDLSVPGSTDGIMWMGVAIAVIVLLPLLTHRTLWRNGSS
jgi:hypothetical protein